MRISVTIFVILILTCIANASVLDPVIENVVHLKASKPPSGVSGMWKKKTIWKPRWVKEWKSAKVMKPVWKKIWSPVQIREWVPIPKPPPGWDSIATALTSLHPKPQKAQIKDSTGHNSFTVHTTAKIPLWDPIPYPESQQPPPPPPFSQSLHNADSSCGEGICDSSHSGTFNQQQISEIIGPRQNPPEYFQNTEHSETVNHLTRLPPDGNNWRPPLQDSNTDNRFNGFAGLPEFLVPPMFQSPPENNFQNLNQQPFFNHVPVPREQGGHSPAFETQNGFRQWIPSPPETQIKGHFITKASDQPYKFHFPEIEQHIKNRTETTHGETFSKDEKKEKVNFQTDNVNAGFRPQADGDTVQEAHLVGEYHYSEFDLPKLKLESKKPQPNKEQKEQVRIEPRQKVKTIGLEVQKHNTNNLPLGEKKQRQNRTETEVETQKPQNSQHVKKHIPNSPSNTSNAHFSHHQQKAILKEILPNRNLPPNHETLIPHNHRFALPLSDGGNKQRLPINLSSTLLLAVGQETDFNSPWSNVSSLHQKENYPVYETQKMQTIIPPNQRFLHPSNAELNYNTLGIKGTNASSQQQKQYPVFEAPRNPTVLAHNHRFSPLTKAHNFNASTTNVSTLYQKEYYPVYEIPEISTVIPPNHKASLPSGTNSPEKPLRPIQYDTKSLLVAPDAAAKTEKPSFERNASVQLVFPTTDEDPSEIVRKLNKYKLSAEGSEQTTSTEPYSVIFSSSLSSTEAATKSPVVIVTPIIQDKS